VLFNYLRIYYQSVYHIQAQIQNTIDGKKAFGNRQSLVGRIVQRSLEPLGCGSNGGIQRIHHHITGQGSNTLTSHGITLVSHGGGADLVLLEGLFHFLQML